MLFSIYTSIFPHALSRTLYRCSMNDRLCAILMVTDMHSIHSYPHRHTHTHARAPHTIAHGDKRQLCEPHAHIHNARRSHSCTRSIKSQRHDIGRHSLCTMAPYSVSFLFLFLLWYAGWTGVYSAGGDKRFEIAYTLRNSRLFEIRHRSIARLSSRGEISTGRKKKKNPKYDDAMIFIIHYYLIIIS